jgi:mannose-6-phosphate isomerase-like protein (cupin superfamily)
MFKQSISQATKREREGLVSYFLLQKGDLADSELAITWVEVAPGSSQKQHHHEPEQVYVIIKGTGRMKVGEEESEVAPGDMVYIPPDVPHSIVNTSTEALVYVSASTPSFDIQSLYDTGRV